MHAAHGMCMPSRILLGSSRSKVFLFDRTLAGIVQEEAHIVGSTPEERFLDLYNACERLCVCGIQLLQVSQTGVHVCVLIRACIPWTCADLGHLSVLA